jgi:opacity protein-like surface antigen
MKVRSWIGGFVVVGLFTAGSAFAAIDASRVGHDVKLREDQVQVGLDVRGGVGGLTGDSGNETAPGGLLGISAVAQPWRNLGIEADVEGQRIPIDDARVGDEQALYRYNLGLLAKAGPPLLNDHMRPYLGAGVGGSYLNVTDGAEPLYDNDFIGEIPLAAGLDYNFGKGISAGARASYRFLLWTEFADAAEADGETSGHMLDFSVTLGGRF